ncbi:GNAT family N-acetyltransferase [Hymenobacter nivis]|uniref:GNAT family N-acetyltransferase n=1 Tax=Hymenobacter nivis TaxID=1850093 RepID=A0A502HEN6_9BACT|nr:GNAT family N-acetyltransferase [Hymenobacter nivis]TPG72135.1 GNAT family N-acetyltransferase [Hymenobacter nivis]
MNTPPALPRIVPATLRDIPAIIQLAEGTWEPTYRFILSREQIEYMYRVIYTPAALKRQMAEQHHTFLLAHVDGQPAGFASFSPQPPADGAPTEAAPTEYKLHKIYVLPTQQGQGLGLHLIEAVEDAVRSAGGRTLDLNVNRYNPALSFYERRGFVQQRAEDVPIGPYFMNDYIMRKTL